MITDLPPLEELIRRASLSSDLCRMNARDKKERLDKLEIEYNQYIKVISLREKGASIAEIAKKIKRQRETVSN